MKKGIVTLGIITLLIGLTITINKEKKELINITNNESNNLAFFIEEEGNYKETDKLPTSGYKLNEEKSFCSNGAEPTWSDNSLEILSLNSSNTNCYLYFDEVCGNACKTILGNITVNEGTPDFNQVATTDEGVFKAQDDDGDTYYFRGAVENNYVKFANKFWRIIRINGDGSIRMIYDGESARANGSKLTVDTSAFNSSINDNMYVGFKYTSGQAQGTGNESTILQKLNTWYTSNLVSYASKIDPNAGFCGDRRSNTSSSEVPNGTGGTGTTTTYYVARYRLVSNKTPELSCESADFYTVSGASKGNKSLDKPVGLITADEVAMAGGTYGSHYNPNYYLYTNQIYWTMSPMYFNSGTARVFFVDSTGNMNDYGTHNTYGVRAVINLRSDVELTGTGTMSDPYVVVGGN